MGGGGGLGLMDGHDPPSLSRLGVALSYRGHSGTRRVGSMCEMKWLRTRL